MSYCGVSSGDNPPAIKKGSRALSKRGLQLKDRGQAVGREKCSQSVSQGLKWRLSGFLALALDLRPLRQGGEVASSGTIR